MRARLYEKVVVRRWHFELDEMLYDDVNFSSTNCIIFPEPRTVTDGTNELKRRGLDLSLAVDRNVADPPTSRSQFPLVAIFGTPTDSHRLFCGLILGPLLLELLSANAAYY